MASTPAFLAGVLLLLASSSSFAGSHHPTRTTSATEQANETAQPSFSRHVRDARIITEYLADALLLTTSQRLAVARCTVAQRQALVLAGTSNDVVRVQYQYLMALRQVLAATQLQSYTMLCHQLDGTTQPLDGNELAVR